MAAPVRYAVAIKSERHFQIVLETLKKREFTKVVGYSFYDEAKDGNNEAYVALCPTNANSEDGECEPKAVNMVFAKGTTIQVARGGGPQYWAAEARRLHHLTGADMMEGLEWMA